MLDYIVDDLKKSRNRLGDESIGGMVVCDSSEQARMMFDIFQQKYAYSLNYDLPEPKIRIINTDAGNYSVAAEKHILLRKPTDFSAALILHDEGTKEDRRQWTNNFKFGYIDILFVYNMLLTGFDAHRLKKLYRIRRLGRPCNTSIIQSFRFVMYHSIG
jgi:type I restriction enzyme R subunit